MGGWTQLLKTAAVETFGRRTIGLQARQRLAMAISNDVNGKETGTCFMAAFAA